MYVRMNGSFEKGDFFFFNVPAVSREEHIHAPLHLSYFVIIFCDHSWVSSKSHCLRARRALRFRKQTSSDKRKGSCGGSL